MKTKTLTLNDLVDLFQPDQQTLADGFRRMTDIWHNRPTDSLPILFGCPAPEGAASNKDIRLHVEDPDQMLYDQLADLLGWALAGSDAHFSVRANTGCGTLCTTAGCVQVLSEFGLPWTNHVSKDTLETYEPIDIASKGVMPRVQGLYDHFRSRLKNNKNVNFFIADTQGPYDLAHLLYGDQLFYDMYDDPEFVHRLMAKATTLYIEGTRVMKEWIGDSPDCGYCTILWMARGVRVCEDTSTLLSPDLIEEFVIPYRRQALEAFGGGYVHYCGDNEALYRSVITEPLAYGLNFGNPERHDFQQVLPELIEAGKFYFGSPHRDEDEPLETYFRRTLSYTGGARKGLIFVPMLYGDEPKEPRRVLDLWRSLQ